jgi:hypothetical protein
MVFEPCRNRMWHTKMVSPLTPSDNNNSLIFGRQWHHFFILFSAIKGSKRTLVFVCVHNAVLCHTLIVPHRSKTLPLVPTLKLCHVKYSTIFSWKPIFSYIFNIWLIICKYIVNSIHRKLISFTLKILVD